jgi:hypothetical protein
MTDSKDLRQQAAKFYEAALKMTESGCCATTPVNAFSSAAGYTQADLGEMPSDAASSRRHPIRPRCARPPSPSRGRRIPCKRRARALRLESGREIL